MISERELEIIWDCAIKKHDTYRISILKSLTSISIKFSTDHVKYIQNKITQLRFKEMDTFVLGLLKSLLRNVFKPFNAVEEEKERK